MRALPKSIKYALGVVTLMSLVGVANADPRIIGTYKARHAASEDAVSSGSTGEHSRNSEDSGETGSTGGTGGTGGTGSTGGTGGAGGTGSTGGTGGTGGTNSAGTAYTIPSNFNFNCNSRNPNSDAIENGRRAYVRLNCTVCHSSTGHGGTMGPSLVGAGDDVAEAVTQGEEGGMPSFKKYLCPNDLADLKAYIDTLGSAASPDFTDWWVAHPPAPFVNSAP